MESIATRLYEIPGGVRKGQQRETVFYEGDEARYFYIVRAGHVCISRASVPAVILALRLARCGNITESRFSVIPVTHICSTPWQRPSRSFMRIELNTLDDYLMHKPDLAYTMLTIVSQHMRKLGIRNPGFDSLRQEGSALRLCCVWPAVTENRRREEYPDYGTVYESELANYSATPHESMNRMLSDLRHQNVIESRGKNI